MATTETYFFTSPDPDFIFEEGPRVDPNQGGFPTDASVHVETETHYLEFDIQPKDVDGKEFFIALTHSLPPLAEAAYDTLVVEGDVLKKDSPFRLLATGSHMATQSFKIIRILANVEVISLPASGEKN
jgi:hypothetical protein